MLEHTKFSAGSIYEDHLIYGGVGGIINDMLISESTSNNLGNLLRFRGKFQEADAVNKNKRSYPRSILESNMERLEDTIREGGLVGELDHPTDSIVHFKDASHKIVKLWWEGSSLMGEGIVLPTPAGKVLKSLIESGVRIGISSRGVGSGKVNEDGILVIGESYKLITFDAVADPSTYSAYQKKVSSKQENVNNYENSSVKNESRSIDRNTNSKLLLACLGGIITQQANKIKRG